MQSSGFAGFVALDDTLNKTTISVSSVFAPLDADALPVYRIYGPNGFMITGSLAFKDTGSIQGASNASPTVVTSANHGLTTGMKITISGILGNTGANGTYVVTKLTSNTFSIAVDTSAGGVYSGGGSWHVVGLYSASITPTAGNSFAAGVSYSVVVHASYSSVLELIDEYQFEVV